MELNQIVIHNMQYQKDIADISRERDINKLADVLSSRIQTQNNDADSDNEQPNV